MYENQTEQDIRQRMLDGIKTDIDKSEGSFTFDAISPAAFELAGVYIELDGILKKAFAQTSTSEYLDRRAEEFGVTRNAGTKSTGIATFTGTAGATIPHGTVIKTDGGLQYKTLADATISGTTVDANIEAVEIGALYNVPANAITQIPVQVIGVSAVTNSSPTDGGTDIETDAALLSRLLSKVRLPSTSGNANHYKEWAMSINGVGDAKVFPLWNGNGTVKVVIIDANKSPASVQLVTDVAAYIETVRPIGATVTVSSAEAVNIDISVSVIKAADYSIQQITTNIQNKITDYLKSIAFFISYASYAQIGNCILDSAGVIDYSNLTVNSGAVNIPVLAEQVAILGTLDVT